LFTTRRGARRVVWGFVMRAVVRLVACSAAIGAVAVLAACSANDIDFYRTGVGTELYTADLPNATVLQNAYLDNICRQASPVVAGVGDPSCSTEISPRAWPLVVQAGMNDIDQRCDAYLAWLDHKRRTNDAILEELGIIRGAVDLVVNSQFGTGPRGLAAVAAAFNFATGTFGKLSSFLLQAEQSTVMSVVLGRRREFRRQILSGPAITNRPLAIHALRSYLSICMPMTIVTDINTTVTVFQQGGPGAVNNHVLVDPGTATGGRAVTATAPAGQKPPRPPELTRFFDDFEKIILNYDPKQFPPSVVQNMLTKLCVPAAEVAKVANPGTVGETAQSLVVIFDSYPFSADERKRVGGKPDGLIDSRERDFLIGTPVCPAAMRNYYERRTFRDGTVKDVSWLVELLNRVPNLQELPPTTTLAAARQRIAEVRKELAKDSIRAKGLAQLPESMATHWTNDLFQVLSNLPEKKTP